jgi:DNA-binding CsgD family transcriptional regulator
VTGPVLTDNELEVLRRAAGGETYAVIARDLGYQEKSVSKMALRLARKLGANNITHAVHLAHLVGLLRRERHGDHAGFTAHVRRGEDPWVCKQGCPEGERAYRAEMRRKRRQEPTGGPESATEAARDVRGGDRAADGRTAPRGEAAA